MFFPPISKFQAPISIVPLFCWFVNSEYLSVFKVSLLLCVCYPYITSIVVGTIKHRITSDPPAPHFKVPDPQRPGTPACPPRGRRQRPSSVSESRSTMDYCMYCDLCKGIHSQPVFIYIPVVYGRFEIILNHSKPMLIISSAFETISDHCLRQPQTDIRKLRLNWFGVVRIDSKWIGTI